MLKSKERVLSVFRKTSIWVSKIRTYSASKVGRYKHSNAEIVLNFSDDFDSVVDGQVRVLVTPFVSCCLSLEHRTSQHLNFERPDEDNLVAYPVQVQGDLSVRVEGCFFAA